MKINLNPRSPESPEVAKPVKTKVSREPGGAIPESTVQDRTELSPGQARVQSLAQQVNNYPETREAKVASLSAAVRDGSYRLSSEKTAAAMIAEMFRSVA